MNHDRIRESIAEAEQATAELEHLVPPGGRYQLTKDQMGAIDALCRAFEAGERAALLEAPTGSGKTAVAFRVMVERKLANPSKPVAILAPTRDLARQWTRYLESRLAGTPLRLTEIHGGVTPHEREARMQEVATGFIAFVVASGMPLQDESMRVMLRGCALVVADDLHAFDERVHLRRLDGLNVPLLALSATPEPVASFIKALGADQRIVKMQAKPFLAPTTHIREVRGFLKMPVDKQVALAAREIEAHLAAGGRIYLVARTRENVPRLAAYVARMTGAPVYSVHGEMADDVTHARRMGQGKGQGRHLNVRTRIEMLESFRTESPSVLVGTNLIAAGLDVPAADLLVVTDADGFGAAEREQLVGRVGRRDLASEAVLVVGTLVSIRGSRQKPRPVKSNSKAPRPIRLAEAAEKAELAAQKRAAKAERAAAFAAAQAKLALEASGGSPQDKEGSGSPKPAKAPKAEAMAKAQEAAPGGKAPKKGKAPKPTAKELEAKAKAARIKKAEADALNAAKQAAAAKAKRQQAATAPRLDAAPSAGEALPSAKAKGRPVGPLKPSDRLTKAPYDPNKAPKKGKGIGRYLQPDDGLPPMSFSVE